ncbi:FecR family protein [Coraliomargarita akajimensis]|uniref:FecR protein domain-containing protein n=1 Tax=Coraliomargarita akajimensis (strain DSM 45221 / IAM 15411 / JCM 23193 / KCTC 12865 / 04OKA010-24) TaxID=583355 RepID=D5EKW3_CORAD|nr:FecR family protein [Coraliomargarita akajimensis]ADE55020.1 hypothetical protein Caka_2002 [Coraliomargarita akajimensis DSM 45221]
MKHLRLQAVLTGLLALSLLPLQAIQAAGAKVTELEGSVTKVAADGSKSKVAAGDILGEGDNIVVGSLSKAALCFSNGSTLTLSQKTSVTIGELKQEEFAGDKSYEQLEADPSKSQTLLELNYGKVDGHVKKLMKGSAFDIETPLGTAAIRGTKYSVALGFNPVSGNMVLSVTNLDGKVDLIARFSGTAIFNGGVATLQFKEGAEEKTVEMAPGTTVEFIINKNNPYFKELLGTANIDPSKLGILIEKKKNNQGPGFTEDESDEGPALPALAPPMGPPAVSPSTPSDT